MILGMNNKLYRNAGSYGSPSWTLIGNHRDGKFSIKASEADSSTRGFSGWGSDEATIRKLQYTFGMLMDESDASYTALRAALMSAPPQVIEFAFADGAIATPGSHYIRASCGIFGLDGDKALEGVSIDEFTLKLSYATNAPSFTTVS